MPEARVRLFCLPFAGGSAAVFHGWGERLKPEIEVWAAQPRARGMRFRETPLASVSEMAEEYLAAMRPGLTAAGARPYAFYGHSLGGLLAFELTRRLQAESLPLPEHLFIGATVPPHMGLIHERIGHLEDTAFVEAIQARYGGIPAEVLGEPELLAMFLPALKSDFAAYEGHRHRPGKISVPMTVFAGAGDMASTAALLEEWDRYTSGPFELRVIPGDHFFLTASSALVLRRIREALEEGAQRELVSTDVTR
jgi:medium-chain acyl-[acyl-carrier-protein] hydrolase